ncbi:MAG: synaptosomal-associated protein 23 [Amphiamblys sp. WSBS2006]|nr:MAG: synaptosomal-associated protein 23 [Amphiamblys sp. WSBS2006]
MAGPTLKEFKEYQKTEEREELERKIEEGSVEDQELAEIKKKTEQTQQETVSSSRRALDVLGEAQETAGATEQTLGKQGEQLGRIGEKGEEVAEKSKAAAEEAETLKKKTGFFGFLTKSKNKKEDKKENTKEKPVAKQEGASPRPSPREERVHAGTKEGEIDENLDALEAGLDILEEKGKGMGSTLKEHSEQIDKTREKAEEATEDIKKGTKHLESV